MNTVFDVIQNRINDQNTFFVFPSETTARLWAYALCAYSDVRSATLDRFLAWDRFKEVSVKVEDRNKSPASSVIRRLFALALAKQNAEKPFLSAIIPADFAANGQVFADSIAALLSSLGRWEALHKSGRDDEEDRDLKMIKTKYAAFLEQHNLFEPSWQAQPFSDDQNRYVIFFPETLTDFAEFAPLLNSPSITFYTIEEFITSGTDTKPKLQYFNSARQEIRSAALFLRRLNEQGIAYENMAITLPDFSNIAPYVERELALHDIPFSRRAGKALGEYPAGRMFSLIADCASGGFSFNSLKPLLLDTSIPWKDVETNRALIQYGIANHCVAPFKDRQRLVDPWEESFKRSINDDLSAYYAKLKQALVALNASLSFSAIRENYFAFREFLDMEKCGKESDAVLARCIEELSELTLIEDEFKDLAPATPFAFFVSHINEKQYVYKQEGGVNLYDYPVAAGAPYRCHLLLNASQAKATIQYRPLAFLRQDKRKRLGLEDCDISEAALALYAIPSWKDFSCYSRISASELSYSGWSIPHSAFAMNYEQAPITNDDPFAKERHWHAQAAIAAYKIHSIRSTTEGSPSGIKLKPSFFYSIQRQGFNNWSSILLEQEKVLPRSTQSITEENKEHLLLTPCNSKLSEGQRYSAVNEKELKPIVASLLTERIQNKGFANKEAHIENGDLKQARLSVSATDLNEFFTCPRLWLYRRIFKLEPYIEDAALLDDESRGLIYHEILDRLFNQIQQQDKAFNKDNIEQYFSLIESITTAVLKSDDTLRGPLVYPLLAPLADAINKHLRVLLKTEAEQFNGYKVKELEQNYNVMQGDVRLTGRIDRVSISPQGETMIVDYKINYTPAKKDCRKDEALELPGLYDFQMPMYIKLYEKSGTKVDKAFFISIHQNKIVNIVGEFPGSRDPYTREEYQDTMDALEEAIKIFDQKVTALDFNLDTIPYKACAACEYKTICRTFYQLDSSEGDDAAA